MTTPWYYESHNYGAFPYQKKLCDIVRWTKYNLEGQQLISQAVLSAIQGNPLTIRLLGLDEGLRLFDEIVRIDKKIQKLSREQLDNNKFSSMLTTWKAENSELDTDAPIEVIEIAGEQIELRYFDIQLALYKFFTNFGSLLDRLAFEIDKMYELDISQRELSWGKLTSNFVLGKLGKKSQALFCLLTEFHEIFSKPIRYRNRLTHDGIIHFEVAFVLRRLVINLREKPNDNDSECNIDAIVFCKDIKEKILTLLNESYRIMILDYENKKVL